MILIRTFKKVTASFLTNNLYLIDSNADRSDSHICQRTEYSPWPCYLLDILNVVVACLMVKKIGENSVSTQQ